MKKCAVLSMDSLDDFECYDHLTFKPLADLGWQAEEISWRSKNPNWDQYDLVIIRSPWDYQQDAEQFLKVLQSIEMSEAQLANPLDIVKWNINKKYLRELEQKGVEIVPSIWLDSLTTDKLTELFRDFTTDEIIIKPCISANADDTFRLTPETINSHAKELIDLFNNRECVIQPFMPAIITEGEYSLFYFNNEYSHAILKTPKEDDFRVQEEHGGRLKKIEPEQILKQSARKVLEAIDTPLLYARLDFVRSKTGFALMEAELIEPSLYFNLDEGSPVRFAKAVDQSING